MADIDAAMSELSIAARDVVLRFLERAVDAAARDALAVRLPALWA